MDKRGNYDSWRYGGGAALIFLGAWIFGQSEGTTKFFGIVFIALGIGLIASGWK